MFYQISLRDDEAAQQNIYWSSVKIGSQSFQFETVRRRATVYLYLTNEAGLILIIVIIWLSLGEPRCHSIISASFSWPFKQSLILGGDKTSCGARGRKLKIWATHCEEEPGHIKPEVKVFKEFFFKRKIWKIRSNYREEATLVRNYDQSTEWPSDRCRV